MGSYTQHLPKLGGTSNMEAPFFFPSTTENPNSLKYYYNSSSYSLSSPTDLTTFRRRLMDKQGVGKIGSNTLTIIGRGMLTQLITPFSNTSGTYRFRVVVDDKDTYKLSIRVGGRYSGNVGVFGGFLIGVATDRYDTQEGVGFKTSDFYTDDVVLLSPLDTSQRGIGIPFESSIKVTKISDISGSSGDFTIAASIDAGTITKES